jgi:peptidyl-prolyl cis-trans isomerase SurA
MLKRVVTLMLLLPVLIVTAQPLDKVVAIVNDGVITASELNTQVEIFKRQLLARGEQLPSDIDLRKQVLQQLIDVDLQLQLAKRNDMTVDDSELNDTIANIASTNHLSLTQMREEVSKQGLSWQTYKENVRKEILINHIQQKAVGQEISISAEQIDDYLKTAAQRPVTTYQTYHLQNIVVPLPEEPTPEQLKIAETKANDLLKKSKKADDFSRLAIAESSSEFTLEAGDLGERHLAELPEVFAKEVLYMSVGQVVGPIRTGNGYQLIKLVDVAGGHGGNQRHEVTKTHVRHILLKQDASMTASEAKRQANNIYQQLKAGKDFALMAKQYSSDTVSAVKGGDLGWVSPGEVVAEFEKAMEALPLHKISSPVKSGFGWHIIEVLGRKKVDDSESFKRQQARQFLHQRKLVEAVQNWQQHMRADAYVNILDKKLA